MDKILTLAFAAAISLFCILLKLGFIALIIFVIVKVLQAMGVL